MHKVQGESIFSYSHYPDENLYDRVNAPSASKLDIEDTDVFLYSRSGCCHPRQVSAFDGLCLLTTTGQRVYLRLFVCEL
jgi:hypothetical protein